MSNIRDDIIRNYEQKKALKQAQETIGRRTKTEVATPSKEEKPKREQPGEFQQFTEFRLVFPKPLLKLIIACHVMFCIIGIIYFARVGDWTNVTLMPVAAVLLTATAVAVTYVQWIFSYLGFKLFWWLSGCSWVLIALFLFYMLMMVIVGKAEIDPNRYRLPF